MKHAPSLLRGLPKSWRQRLRFPGIVLPLALGGLPLAAQNTPGAAPAPATDNDTVVLDEMVVNTVRGSLIGAQEIKQNSTQFVDSIVAEDIGKLPDNTVADALQRVPGIQVGRDNGEVVAVRIRGLPNFATTLNGHEIYTGTGRGVALQDLPADLVAGVDVYKTNAPDQIEGGIAGLIDIRLRRPLELEEGTQFAASGRYIHGENAADDSWVGSALLSNRWKLTGGGEFGALIAAAYQNIVFADQRTFNFLWEPVAPVPPNSLPPGSGSNTELVLPVTAGSLLTPGDRKRPAFNTSLQWKPNENLEFYTDLLFTGYRNKHDVYFFIGFPRDGALFGTGQSVTLVEGTNVVDTIVTSPANFQLTSTQAFDDDTDGYQWVGGMKWQRDRMKVTSELVYNWNVVRTRAVIVDTQFVPPAGSTPTFTFDLNSPSGTNVSITGADITDPANFRFWGLFDNRTYAGSEQWAGRVDLEHELDGMLTKFKVGLRVSDREVRSRASNRNDIAPAAGRGNQVITTVPGFGSPAPDGLFSSKQFGASNWVGGNADFQRDNPDTIRGIFGLPAGDSPFDPTQTFNDIEQTYAVYGQANYETEIGGKRVTGLFGVRIVKTEQELQGLRGDFSEVEDKSSQTDVLPSLTARVELDENVILRLAASRSVTRPNFADLNPVTTLTSGTTTNPVGTGSGGNPDLDSVISDNIDLSIENYFGRSSYVALTGFYRRIDGYVQSFAAQETHELNGVQQQFSVVRPRNSGTGNLYGFEATYQHFFDNLPGIFRGLGVHANYTYITGENSVADTGEDEDFTQVSKHSYNLIGIYERGPFSARLAYNYRGRFVDTFNGPNPAGSPLRVISVKPTERVDFNMTYRINEHLTATFDITNLFDSKFQDYFGPDPAVYPRDTRMYDRTFELGLRYRF